MEDGIDVVVPVPEPAPVTPEVIPEVAPVVIPEATPEVAPAAPAVGGPKIIYLSEAARNVQFKINPAASVIVVNESGLISEDL